MRGIGKASFRYVECVLSYIGYWYYEDERSSDCGQVNGVISSVFGHTIALFTCSYHPRFPYVVHEHYPRYTGKQACIRSSSGITVEAQ